MYSYLWGSIRKSCQSLKWALGTSCWSRRKWGNWWTGSTMAYLWMNKSLANETACYDWKWIIDHMYAASCTGVGVPVQWWALSLPYDGRGWKAECTMCKCAAWENRIASFPPLERECKELPVRGVSENCVGSRRLCGSAVFRFRPRYIWNLVVLDQVSGSVRYPPGQCSDRQSNEYSWARPTICAIARSRNGPRYPYRVRWANYSCVCI